MVDTQTSPRAWTRWSDWVEVVVGVVALLSPLLWLDTSTKTLWTMVILGALIAIDGLVSLAAPSMMASETIQAVLGVLLFIAPWVMSFASDSGAAWTSWIAGALTIVASGLALPAVRSSHRLTGQH
ncbi:MAG TPA: SPW repeat protein [Pseudonocardiaceae bacterium]|nr:SPW repeat protein [Pseudonocardiaceae bacterium]